MKRHPILFHTQILVFAVFAGVLQTVPALAQRTVSFQIEVQEPRAGFVRQAVVDLECQGKGCQGGARTLITLNRSGNVFSGTYDIPNSVVDMLLVPRVRFVVDNAAFPNVGWRTPNRDPMKFTDPHSPMYRTYSNAWSVDFRELTVRARYWDGQTWVNAQPDVLIRGTMPAAGQVVSVAMIHEADFVDGSATIALPFGDHFLSPTQPLLEVEGRLGATMPDADGNPITTQLIQMERAAPQFGAANEVRLEFVSLAWLEPIRRGIERDLGFAGVPEARAIAEVEFFIDPTQNGAQWRQERLKRDVWYETTRIALGPAFDHKVADSGDTLLHEWTHELAYRAGWRALGTLPNGTACPTGHSFGDLCPCEWQGWDEAVSHFAGSHLLGRALSGTSGLRVTDGASWLDTNADVRRGIALGLLPACIQRFNRNNPGSWTEDVVAGALIELYRAEGFDTESQPRETLRAFAADWRGFAGRYAQAERTGRNFFLYKRANVNSPVPTVDARAVDQMGLWYLITTRQDIQALGPIEQLVPLRLDTTTPRVQPDQQASFKASARAFHRLVGQYRNYGGNSIRVRLTENGKQVGNEANLSADAANPEYNFVAQLANAWPNDTDKPVEHRVRAEVWGNFINMNDEPLGRSDEVVVTVEGKKQTTTTPNGNKAVLKAPDEVVMTEFFPVSVELPAAIAARAKSFSWGGADVVQNGSVAAGGSSSTTSAPSATMQFRYGPEFFPKGTPTAVTKAINVTARDAQSMPIVSASADVLVKPAGFSGSASSIWEGDAAPTGVNLKRTLIKGPVWRIPALCYGPAANGSTSEASGDVHANWETREQFSSPQDIAAVLPGRAAKGSRITPFSLGDFKGYIAVTEVAYAPGHVNCDTGFLFGHGSGSGFGWVMKGHAIIRVDYRASASGCWDNHEQAWVEAQAKAIAAEAQGILSGLTISALPKFVKTPYQGRPPGAPQPQLRLVLSPDKKRLRPGEEVSLQAAVDNLLPEDGTPRFSWTGINATGGTATFVAETAGKKSVSVTASLSTTTLGPESAEIEVISPEVKIVRVSPAGHTVRLGEPVTLEARVTWAGAPLSGAFTMRWQPLEEFTFQPQENASLTTTVRFMKPGAAAVWVSVLEMRHGQLGTVGDSDELTIPVAAPRISIAFDPMGPYVGQPTKARVALDVDIPQDQIDFAWELTNNAKPLTPLQGVRDIAFIPRNNDRITVVVRARAPRSGEDLGSATATLVIHTYNVQAKVIGPVGAKPDGYDLVGKPGAIAAGQSVLLHADISPQPPGRVHFVWFAQGGTIENPEAGKEVTAHKNEPGSCQIVVRAEDDEHNLLGEGTTVLDVVISTEEMEKAKQGKVLADKLAQVRALAQSGKYEEAVKTLEEVIDIDREAARPTTTELLATLEKLGKEATGRRDWAAARRFFEMALRLNPQDREALIGRNNLQAYEQRDREVKAWCAEADALISQGRLATAEPKILSIQLWEKDLPSPVSPLAQSVIQRYEQALASYKADMAEARAKVGDSSKRRDWEPALAILRGLQSKEMFKEDANWVGATIDAILQYQREDTQKKAQAAQLKAEGLALENQGKIQDAIGKYRQSLGYWPDAALEGHTKAIEEEFKRRSDAYLRLYNEGHTLESRGDLRGALAKYEEAYGILPNKDLLPIIEGLRGRISQLDQEEQRRARAQQLVSEGTACEQRGDLNCAITKYEAAVAILPNQQVSEKITQLKATLAQNQAHRDSQHAKSLNTGNVGGVRSGPTAATTFRVSRPARLVKITNYHWNGGRGARPGSIEIRLTSGGNVGSWPAAGLPGSGGAPNAYWTVEPGVDLTPGTYTVVDSDPASWSCNAESGGRGMSEIVLVPLGNASADFVELLPAGETATSQPHNIGEDRLGHEWSVTEAATFTGRWVRRGNSNIWDASWNNGAVAELSITIAGDKLRISRRDVGGTTIGVTALYEGTLAPDGTMQGTETATWPGHFTNQKQQWQGRIVTPSPSNRPGWRTTASGYPDIAGEWIEVSGFPSNGSPITITQSGATIVAVGRYAIGTRKIAYRVDGTLTRDGVITGRLVHTEGVTPGSSGFAQDRRMTLTPDGNELDISAASVGGGGAHQLRWRRAASTRP